MAEAMAQCQVAADIMACHTPTLQWYCTTDRVLDYSPGVQLHLIALYFSGMGPGKPGDPPPNFKYFGWWAVLVGNTRYTLKLARADGLPSETATILASSEPGKEPPALVAIAYDENGQVVPNVAVRLQAAAVPNSGGHVHGDDSSVLRTGTLSSADPSATLSQNGQVLTGNTGPSGFAFSLRSPSVSGDISISATCTDNHNCTQNGPAQIWVGIKDLQPAAGLSVYHLIPNSNDLQHPNNHYFTMIAATRVAVFANLYHAKYPDKAVLQLNDSSLERGGILDLDHNWQSPHLQHCRGTVVDIRANGGGTGFLNITSDHDPMISSVKAIGRIVGANAAFEIPTDKHGVPQWNLRHFHTLLMGAEGTQCP